MKHCLERQSGAVYVGIKGDAQSCFNFTRPGNRQCQDFARVEVFSISYQDATKNVLWREREVGK